VFLPGYYRGHHNMPVTEVLAQPTTHHESGPTISALDPAWWAATESYDTTINRLWLSMSAALILWGAASLSRVSYLVHASRRRQVGTSSPNIVDGVPVVVTDSLGPATVGLLRSRVLIPRWVLALPVFERKYVVRHEEEHRRAHDARVLFLASLPIILMPWNLAMWWQLRRLSLAVEMDCDNRVVSKLGDPTAYGELLLKIAQAANRTPRLQPARLGGMGSLEHRLTVLLAPTPLRHLQRFILPLAVGALLAIVIMMPHPIIHAGQ
jgi:beta-lactamase regulating signal transducer with metallopeptidase domain